MYYQPYCVKAVDNLCILYSQLFFFFRLFITFRILFFYKNKSFYVNDLLNVKKK